MARWDEELYAIWGLSPETPDVFAAVAETIHPDDRGPWEADVAASLDPQRTGEDRGRHRIEMRIRHAPSGETRWVRANGTVTFEGGVAVRMVGTVAELRREIEAEKRELETLRANLEKTRDTMRTEAQAILNGKARLEENQQILIEKHARLKARSETLLRRETVCETLAAHVGDAERLHREIKTRFDKLSGIAGIAFAALRPLMGSDDQIDEAIAELETLEEMCPNAADEDKLAALRSAIANASALGAGPRM